MLNGLKNKVKKYVDNSNKEIKDRAIQMGMDSAGSLLSLVPEEARSNLAKSVLSQDNASFYLDVATIQRHQEMSFPALMKEGIYYGLYSKFFPEKKV